MKLDQQKSVRQDAEHSRRDAGAPQHGLLKRTAAMLGLATCLVLSGFTRAEEQKASMALTSPVSCQVIQRGKTEQAAILIDGTLSDKADVIEAMVGLAPGAKRGSPVKWVAITPNGQTVSGKFTGSLTLPAGGWYQLTRRTGPRVSMGNPIGSISRNRQGASPAESNHP